MKRFPVVATTIVVLAIAAMIGLGLWQLLDRRPQKLAFLQQLAGNPVKPVIPFPTAPDESLLFRRTSATCSPRRRSVATSGPLTRTSTGVTAGLPDDTRCTSKRAPGTSVVSRA